MKRVILSLATVASLGFGSVHVFDGSTVKVDFTGQIGKGGHVQFFIDADNNPGTGYSRGGSKAVRGADYLIEDGTLFKRKNGVSGWSRGWQNIGRVKFDKSAYKGVMFVPKSKVPVINGAKFTAYALPKNWANSGLKSLGTGVLHSSSHTDNTQPPKRGKTENIYIIGPSTVNYENPSWEHKRCRYGNVIQGWGDRLGEYLKDPQKVYNYAREGSSASSFREGPKGDGEDVIFGPNRDHYWAKVEEKIRRDGTGGFLLIQFGGNDLHEYDHAHLPEAQRKRRFKSALKFYIRKARELGVTPVLITSVNWRKYDRNGNITDARRNMPAYMKELGREEHVRVLDLYRKSFNYFATHEEEEVNSRLGQCSHYRRDGSLIRIDYTHFEPRGAKVVAGWIKELACEQPNSKLCQQFR